MKNSITPSKSEIFFNRTIALFQGSQKWFFTTPERALEQAHQAALKIHSLENEYFGGQKISANSGKYSQNTLDCFQADLDKYLQIIKLRITEFKISRFFIKDSGYTFLERLRLIDDILLKYSRLDDIELSTLKAANSFRESVKVQVKTVPQSQKSLPPFNLTDIEPVTKKTGPLPRSIGRTLQKITTQVSPNSEEELVQNFRASRRITRQAINFLILLILVPLLTQEVSKQFLILPIVEHMRSGENAPIFINSEMKEEALKELQAFEEELKFENLLQHTPKISPEVFDIKVTEKAVEIAEEFKNRGSSSVSNVFADLLGLLAFAGVVVTNRRGLAAVKTLLNEVIYGLSDSAKAFILILFTDIFVGFHSPHGWEVILESVASHLGLPANRNAIFLFIATFPVILDTIFKYWIFRYLNQISPSAVATLKNMNE